MRLGLLLLMAAALLPAQSTTQSIQGLVTDSSGAIIVGARITITNTGTGVTRTDETNNTGNFSFQLVPVGNYEIRAEMQGFKTQTVRGVRVETAAQVRNNFTLEVGDVTETVEVSASAVTLNTENATVGGVIENKRITELPLNGRNVVQLAVLIPGVQFGERTGRGDGLGGFPIPGQGFSVSANGQRETHQVVSLDGVDAKDPRIHITNFVPSIEAIEEFKIQTNAFTAEYGFGGGAYVNITMKSGTNNLHGTLFHFLRNEKLDAEHYFLNFELAPGQSRKRKDAFRRNQFGLVVSGPVVIPKLYDGRNKTFWAFNMEHRLDRREEVQTQAFPLDPFRQGNFQELLTGTINPATGRVFRAPIVIYDPYTGDPFPNNILPQSRLHPGALNVLNTYVPRAEFRQTDPLDFTSIRGVHQPIDAHQYFARVDHYFSDKDRIFGRIAMDRSGLTRNHINPNLPVFVDSKVSNLATQWIHTFSHDTLNEFRFGFNISDDLTSNPRTDNTTFDMDALGVGQVRVFSDGNRKLTTREHGIPNFSGLPFTLQELTNGNGYDNMDTIQFGNHVSLIRGKHNLKVGAEVYRISMERGAANLEEGILGFSANETGYSLASFLLGLPNNTQSAEGLPLTFPRANRFGAYFHDDWKVTPRLTVNVGLRFDYNGFPVDSQGLWRTLDFVGTGPVEGRGGGYQTATGQVIPTVFPGSVDESGAVKLTQQRTWRFFMPRVGIAFRPTDKWVIRTGAGWFDNINHVNTWTIFNLMPPKSGSLLFNSVTDLDKTIAVTAADGSTANIRTRRYRDGQPILTLNDPFLQQTGGAAVTRPINLLHLPQDYLDGDVWKWSFDIQRELPGAMSLTVGYVGSKGSHVGNSIGNYNQAPPSSNTNIQARRPHQSFYDPATPNLGVQALGNIRYIDSFGESFYHGLQVRLDRHYRSGVAVGISYTLSKAHGDGENGGQEGVAFQDPLDRRGSRGRFRFDQRHNFVAHYVWELPGQHMSGPLKHIIGGWQTNGILSLRSGFPFTVGQGGDLNTGGPVRPDIVGDPKLDNPTRKLWFNPQAFQRVTCNIGSRPDLCRFGSAGYNIIDEPGQTNLDFSLFKNFAIRESVKLQFRSEFTNAFNTPFFGTPNGIGFTTNDSIVPNGTRMGEVRSLRTPMRIIQFGLKLFF
ncbi:MAG: carboxypeptidase regulatory-like domain-containing protein [Bryobacteraceae bacterium]|nr:carboxypeptidase regulatory-like domain-containing protein [Bryobacteraceae bacterium]